jgi:hypothetical protein
MKTARIQIPACPAAGEGVHRWVLEAFLNSRTQ